MEKALNSFKTEFLTFINMISNKIDILSKNLDFYIKNIPDDLFYLGFFIGFLACLIYFSKKATSLNQILKDLCFASTKLFMIFAVVISVYIVFNNTSTNIIYYLVACFIGSICFYFIDIIFSFLGSIGNFINIIITILAGPFIILVSWFFYNKELLEKLDFFIK